ncbi:MAG: outer membrane protein assembly factor BamA [Rickettsiaceae bacterium]|nr:outer membrane protein assembly factor BamA [Rickettsiaceae bacterium]
MNKILNIILILCINILSFEALSDPINKIIISGNQRIETNTIRELLGTTTNEEFSLSTKDNILKKLYASNLFDKVTVEYDNGILKILVKENLFVSAVELKGNKKIKSNILEAEMLTNAGESFKEYKINSDVKTITELYQRMGRFGVHVEPIITNLTNNRVKVTFDIREGPKIAVKNIYFVGNAHYTNSDLKNIILTRESNLLSFLTSNDIYDPLKIEQDKILLQRFYQTVGFADCRVISATTELAPTKDSFIVTYSIDEGQKYSFGKMTLKNQVLGVNNEEILALIPDREGDLFNINKVQLTADAISNFLNIHGFSRADVEPVLQLDLLNSKVDVIFVIAKVGREYINKINIVGNVKTEDQVIRRELKFDEGDVLNKHKVDRALRNLRNLNYFREDLSIMTSETDQPDRVDLNIAVEDKSTSNIGFEIGYDSSGGGFGRISFIERNLVGTGRTLNAGTRIAKKSIYYNIGIIDPYFLGHNFVLSTNLYHSDNGKGSSFESFEKQKYSLKATGASIALGYNIFEDLSHQIEYGIKSDKLKTGSENVAIHLKEQEGSFLASSIGHTLTYDKLDNIMSPKDGYLLTGTQTYTGLGGNSKHIKHEATIKFYKSFVDNKYTLNITASAGHIQGISGKKVRLPDRFNLGGSSLRGFDQAGIGPRVKPNPNAPIPTSVKDSEGEPLGGQKYYTITTELFKPLTFLPKEIDVKASVFLDIGSLWDADSKTDYGYFNDKSLRASVGFGFLLNTQFAPVRFDFGFPIRKKSYDVRQTFNLRFATEL